jgi:NAD-dependent deacetylase
MTDLLERSLQRIHSAADIIRTSQKVVLLTGAGVSTRSGIPDFRSTEGGLWQRYDPFEVASLNAFRYDPTKFYEWLRPLANTIYHAQPNPAHFGIARMETTGNIQAVITQNIDRLHQRAGSKNVLEVHGTFDTMTCGSCFQKVGSDPYIRSYLTDGTIPTCNSCHTVLKPDVVLFGEQLPQRTWLKASEASRNCDLMIVAGSSLEVLPVAGLPMRAVENGAHLIIINQTRTYIDERADIVLEEDVAEIIPMIIKEVLSD